ncbi:DNA ligase [Arthrobacter phage DrSierra]|uniref:DNA ligase n=1 Tax=Arthrobacter phage DrSierra TaxID=2704034 RepID=A0A6G6XK94_9CAUD|nr:DNA ligase [Arthrobacter phage DrSierra]QIG58518.1 DNA ligase [Arthrobacter phage DrSierra]
MSTPDVVASQIERRRRQILVHSILYYKHDRPLIADHVYDAWAQELIRLQAEHPEVSEGVTYHRDAFRNFTSSTGYDLPLDDDAANRVARDLLTYSERTTK